MKIHLITPSSKQSLSGNHTTAARWTKILRSLGHQVKISQTYSGETCDAMIALHAWRSADSISLFAEKHPQLPLIVALTGTDAYRFIHSHPDQTLRSLQLAHVLIGLHSQIKHAIPESCHSKLKIIYQSLAYKPVRKKPGNTFKICVAGHLRFEKDSLRPAYAVKQLPKTSKIYVNHYGKAHSADWDKLARSEMAKNQRYYWHGEIKQAYLHRILMNSKLLALPSRMEGGANIASEAIVLGTPVIASNIEGSRGLLGEDYPGYYPVEDTSALRQLLLRCEKDVSFYQTLTRHCQKKRELFTPSREKRSWKKLLSEFL